MNSNYLLPVSVAAAIHGVLLFGFAKSPRVPAVTLDSRDVMVFPLPPKDLETVEIPEAGGEETKQKEAVITPPPMQPEPLVPQVDSAFTFIAPKIEPSVPGVITNIIPVGLRTGGGDGPDIETGPILPIYLDNSPRTRFQPAPHYPPAAKVAGLTGEVTVEFTVDEGGRVIDPQVVRSSDRMFEEPTLRAVSKWQFEPGRRAGRIVRFRMACPWCLTSTSETGRKQAAVAKARSPPPSFRITRWR